MARLWCCSNILSKQTNLTSSLSKSNVKMHRFLLCWLYIFCHHLHTLFEKYNLKKQTSDVKGSTKVLCLNVIYVWYMWHMWKYVIYVKICDVICDMSNATMSQYLAEITAILWLPPMVLSQTVVQTNEVAFILILNDFS